MGGPGRQVCRSVEEARGWEGELGEGRHRTLEKVPASMAGVCEFARFIIGPERGEEGHVDCVAC